jgi:hypothetical protein
MAAKYTNIFHCKTLQNRDILLEKMHLATLVFSFHRRSYDNPRLHLDSVTQSVKPVSRVK